MLTSVPVQIWKSWQKIAFRFFFLFLTLQIFTENFLGNLFGVTFFIWKLGEKIFVQPCLWLNHHIFHFKYSSQGWTTFSGSLHTIRDIVYLLAACLVCMLWTIFDKKRANYNKLFYWFSQFLVVGLSAITFAYGIIKVFPVQMQSPSFIGLQTPLGDLSPFNLIWTTFGYGKPYQMFSGIFEVAGAVLILFNRTRVAGLLIIIAVMSNVIMLNYTYQIGVLITSFYIFLIALFLLAPYVKQLVSFFFTQQPAVPFQHEYVPGKNVKTKLFKLTAILFIGTSFTLSTRAAYDRYSKTEHTNNTRQYSLVKNYVVNKDTLKLVENDTLCWRIWSERVTDGKRFVTISTMKPGATKTYTIEQDSSKHSLTLHPFNQVDSTALNFRYTDTDKVNWCLDGTIKQKNIRVELQKINPDTMITLLKTKRVIIPTNDETDSQ
ncbi:MAG: hypothetical protein ACM3H8_16745 [Sphingobacteriales bacterium]